MQSYEEAPPPYPGTEQNVPPSMVTSKGNYKGVPVYEVGPNVAPVCKFFIISFAFQYENYLFPDNQPTYQQQQTHAVFTGVTAVPTHPIRIGRSPVQCICPRCHQQIITRVDYVCMK